jgi:hypothetical protein
LNTQTQQAVSDTELIYLLKIKDVTALPLLYDAYAKAIYNLIFQIVSTKTKPKKYSSLLFFIAGILSIYLMQTKVFYLLG